MTSVSPESSPKTSPAPQSASAFGSFSSGAAAGALSRVLVAPLDVVKIRLQLSPSSRSASLIFSDLAVKEGVAALWKGSLPAMFLWMGYTGIQFHVYDTCMKKCGSAAPNSATASLMSGSIAGFAATTTTYPLDIMRTVCAQHRATSRLSIFEAARLLASKRALFQGLPAALVNNVPLIALQFSANNVYLSLAPAPPIGQEPSHLTAFVCGGAAGVTAKMMTMPLDTAKKHLQVQGMLDEHGASRARYSSTLQCMRSIVATHGPQALFRGTYLSLVKSGSSSACVFMLYSAFQRLGLES